MAKAAELIVKLSEVEPVKSILSELAWVMAESDGVVGLSMQHGEATVMEWREVIDKYMPTLAKLVTFDGTNPDA